MDPEQGKGMAFKLKLCICLMAKVQNLVKVLFSVTSVICNKINVHVQNIPKEVYASFLFILFIKHKAKLHSWQ